MGGTQGSVWILALDKHRLTPQQSFPFTSEEPCLETVCSLSSSQPPEPSLCCRAKTLGKKSCKIAQGCAKAGHGGFPLPKASYSQRCRQ